MERKINVYKNYFYDFFNSLNNAEKEKVFYVMDLLKVEHKVSKKFVKHLREGLYEIRIEYNGNIYRIFFVFDKGNIVVLFNGFQKKSQKTPVSELSKALEIKKDYENEK